MLLEILQADGIGRSSPIVIPIAQAVIRMDDGTPIAAIATYGPDGAVSVTSAAFDAAEFHRVLRVLGINRAVVVNELRLPSPPSGARLVAAPKTATRR